MYDVELRNVVKEFVSRNQTTRAVDEVSLGIERGEFFALLGPSGCGKTTSLRMIAGFEQPTAGQVIIRGTAMQGIPAFHRPVNTVFQDYALFPHMNVLQNVMFGLQMEGVGRKKAAKRAQAALELVRLPNIGNRKATQLSGGQQQRVALARALVKEPAVLLLDEPLGALDLKLRKEMQFELKAMQQRLGITFIYVTHDQEEALTMADRIAVMEGGKVLQVGTPREVYEHPATYFVAEFIGETNFITGELLEKKQGVGHVRIADDTVVTAQLPDDHPVKSGTVTIPLRPERIGLAPHDMARPPESEDITVLSGTVLKSQYIGTDTRYIVRVVDRIDLVVRVQNVDYKGIYHFEPGAAVQVFWPLASTYILDR